MKKAAGFVISQTAFDGLVREIERLAGRMQTVEASHDDTFTKHIKADVHVESLLAALAEVLPDEAQNGVQACLEIHKRLWRVH